MISDAQSVKNTDTAKPEGLSRAGKEVFGIKRHIAVDTQGLPDAIAVTTATPAASFPATGEQKLGAAVEVAKRNALHTFKDMPKRWVGERSFAWIEKCRRLWKTRERKFNTSLQMIHLAFLVPPIRRS